MKYLLDTNICVFFFRRKFDIVNAVISKGFENCCVSEITVAELRYGAENSANPQKHHRLIDEFLYRVSAIPITDNIRKYAEEKVRLQRAGTPIHDEFDLLIAASAIHQDLILVTENIRDFKNFPNIKIENWVRR